MNLVTDFQSAASFGATEIRFQNFAMDCTPLCPDEIQTSRAAASAEDSAGFGIVAEKSDAQLVELVLSGDETAFADIFDRYKRLVAVIAGRYFQRPEQIEEIIQISFAKIYFDLKNFRGHRDNFLLTGWIGKITTNACLDRLRAQKRKPENLWCEFGDAKAERLLADAAQNQKTAENAVEERDLAEKLLANLAAEDRALLEMLDAEEMSVREVAEITGWSGAKIKVRAYRARNALRKILRKFL